MKPIRTTIFAFSLLSTGCVMSVSKLPPNSGPPTWQGEIGGYQGPIQSAPPQSTPGYPPGTPSPTRDLGPLPPASERELEVPRLGTSGPATHRPRVRSASRLCMLPE